jgi:hypothetical protein
MQTQRMTPCLALMFFGVMLAGGFYTGPAVASDVAVINLHPTGPQPQARLSKPAPLFCGSAPCQTANSWS